MWHVFQMSFSDSSSYDSTNFLKGCRFSPDGSCLLTSCEENLLYLYETPYSQLTTDDSSSACQPWSPVLRMSVDELDCVAPSSELHFSSLQEGETIYDYQWHPGMQSSNPTSCLFVTTSRDHPIHIWDAFTGSFGNSPISRSDCDCHFILLSGQIKDSFRAYSDVDEVTAALSLAFNPQGLKAIFKRTHGLFRDFYGFLLFLAPWIGSRQPSVCRL